MSMTDHRGLVADPAANAALLEIAENLGRPALLDRSGPLGAPGSRVFVATV